MFYVTGSHNNVKSLSNERSKHKNINKGHNNQYLLETRLKYYYLYQDLALITPSIGVKYDISKIGVYAQDKTDSSKLHSVHKGLKEVSIIAGVEVDLPKVPVDYMEIIPTLRTGIERKVNTKTLKVKLNDETVTLPRSPRNVYNSGISLTFKKNNIEASISYDISLAKKYKRQEGSIKLKLAL